MVLISDYGAHRHTGLFGLILYLHRFLAVQPDTPWDLRNGAMLSLGYDLLTRRSELVALRTDDIEMRSDGTLRVPRTARGKTGGS